MLRRGETLTERGRAAVAMIERQMLQMNRLVDELLDLSRITRGTISIVPDPTPLGPLAARVAESLRPTLAARGQTLALELPAQPLVVRADPARLVQVLENLLGNASKFSPAGGTITLTVAEDREGARVVVTDPGVGIEAGDLERVFEMFVQADAGRAAADAQGGLGIGLAMVRRLVELHGGRVRAESPGRGHGATFTVVLPRTLPSAPPVA